MSLSLFVVVVESRYRSCSRPAYLFVALLDVVIGHVKFQYMLYGRGAAGVRA